MRQSSSFEGAEGRLITVAVRKVRCNEAAIMAINAASSETASIRGAAEADAAEIAAIYAHHVLHGTASYDTEPPSDAYMRDKIRWVLGSGWPFLAAESGGEIVGYAYATQFRDRAAYRWTAENSIYVRHDRLGRGIGKALLLQLLHRTEECGFRQMIAVIGGAAEASVRLHASCGFRVCGRLHAAGWKHGRWLDNVYMQKALGEGSGSSPE